MSTDQGVTATEALGRIHRYNFEAITLAVIVLQQRTQIRRPLLIENDTARIVRH